MITLIIYRGETVLVDRLSYLGWPSPSKPYQKGDVVISRSPQDHSKNLCKRIVATEGDIVVVVNKHKQHEYQPVIDQIIQDSEGYPVDDVASKLEPFAIRWHKIDHGKVWLAGDNSDNSLDCRVYGPVRTELLVGKVFLSLFRRSDKHAYSSYFPYEVTMNALDSHHTVANADSPKIVIVYDQLPYYRPRTDYLFR